MSYNLNGKKILIYVNVTKYDSKDDRLGADIDERKIVDTFKEKVYLDFHKIPVYLIYLNAWHFKIGTLNYRLIFFDCSIFGLELSLALRIIVSNRGGNKTIEVH